MQVLGSSSQVATIHNIIHGFPATHSMCDFFIYFLHFLLHVVANQTKDLVRNDRLCRRC